MQPIDIGTRLELFVDDHLIADTDDIDRRLHSPQPEEVVLVHDDPWEGNLSRHHSVFEDDGIYRMYYRPQGPGTGTQMAYAESEDGLEWEKPTLGRYEFEGSTRNNIVTELPGSGNVAVWKDDNPDCDSEEIYKALERGNDLTLEAYTSPDGFEWSPVEGNPVMTEADGVFDTQNLAFWDPIREEYRSYTRDFDESGDQSRRVVQTATSDDFREWTDPVPLEYPDAPYEQLYTNCIKPYYRAPHIFLGFPMRYVERDPDAESIEHLPDWHLREQLIDTQGRQGYATTDVLFMASHDGQTFTRWPEPFIRPGLWRDESTANWFYGSNCTAWQLLETDSPDPEKPRELSIYATEHYRGGPDVTSPGDLGAARMRRYSLRLDGFVSAHANRDGGELFTEPLTFAGDELVLNYATSAAGSMRVELQAPDGTPYDGYTLADSPDLFGDDLARTVTWADGRSAADLAGRPVQLRFSLHEADLYSIQFPWA